MCVKLKLCFKGDPYQSLVFHLEPCSSELFIVLLNPVWKKRETSPFQGERVILLFRNLLPFWIISGVYWCIHTIRSAGSDLKKKNSLISTLVNTDHQRYRYMWLWAWLNTRPGEGPFPLMTQTWSTRGTWSLQTEKEKPCLAFPETTSSSSADSLSSLLVSNLSRMKVILLLWDQPKKVSDALVTAVRSWSCDALLGFIQAWQRTHQNQAKQDWLMAQEKAHWKAPLDMCHVWWTSPCGATSCGADLWWNNAGGWRLLAHFSTFLLLL